MKKIFLKLGTVMGSSTDPGYVQWIELLSCSFPQGRSSPKAPVLPPPGSNKKRQIELQCSKHFDSSSGILLKMVNDGAAVDSATVEFVDDDTGISNNMYLSEVMLTSFGTRQDTSNSVIEIFGLMCKFKPPDEKGKEVFYIFNPVTKRYER
jgi:type VI protein secretion system component Hcp